MKDYRIYVECAPAGRVDVAVCAHDYQDAISQSWSHIPKDRYEFVSKFRVLSIHACQHRKSVIV